MPNLQKCILHRKDKMVSIEKRRARQKRYRDTHKEKIRIREQQYYLANKERINARHKRSWKIWYLKNGDRLRTKMRQRAREKSYGVSPSKLAQLLAIQNGRCAICKTPIQGKEINVDHCHKSKRIRGLLCRTCNTGLGCFKDDLQNLVNAIVYLK